VAILRAGIGAPAPVAPDVELPTREATLRKLEVAAAEGSVSGMGILARELRLGGPAEAPTTTGRVNVRDLPPGAWPSPPARCA
jgi:hypothetical protein